MRDFTERSFDSLASSTAMGGVSQCNLQQSVLFPEAKEISEGLLPSYCRRYSAKQLSSTTICTVRCDLLAENTWSDRVYFRGHHFPPASSPIPRSLTSRCYHRRVCKQFPFFFFFFSFLSFLSLSLSPSHHILASVALNLMTTPLSQPSSFQTLSQRSYMPFYLAVVFLTASMPHLKDAFKLIYTAVCSISRLCLQI